MHHLWSEPFGETNYDLEADLGSDDAVCDFKMEKQDTITKFLFVRPKRTKARPERQQTLRK